MDTTRSNVAVGTQFLTGVMARPYFATEPWLFEQIMDALARSIQRLAISQEAVAQTMLQDFTFIDLGSGKGRVLLMASEYPFQKIIGVEFMPELHRAAQKNIAGYSHAIGSDAGRSKPSAWMRGIFSFLQSRWWSTCSILFPSQHSRGCWRIYGSRSSKRHDRFIWLTDSRSMKRFWRKQDGWKKLREPSNG